MLTIKNESDDRDFIITGRDVRSGRDGESTTLEPGESATIDAADGEYQFVISTRAREEGEEALLEIPTAQKGERSDDRTEPLKTDASDDDVRSEIAAMIEAKEGLNGGGTTPTMDALNERLAAKGFNPVNAKRRDALMPQPA